MWEGNYIGGLTLLPGTLAELGAAVQMESVSLEREVEDEDEWFPPSNMLTAASAMAILDSLENRTFFLFLRNLSGIAREVQSALATTPTWKETRFIYRVEHILKPVQSHMSHFAPKKCSETLLAMKNFLEESTVLDWDGPRSLGHLLVVYEHLEDLQPGSRLNSLLALDCLLWTEDRHLTGLAVHPLTEKKLGRWNVFAQLISVRKDMKDALIHGPLMMMQKVFQGLDSLRAIDFQDADLYD